MSKKNKRRPTARAEPAQKRSAAWLCSADAYDVLCCQGYTNLAHNPAVCAAVDTIARLIGSMTIYLMRNTENGDVRVKDELSRKIDINPNSYMGRSNFVQWIVKTMFLGGDGNAVVWPSTRAGYIRDLIPIPAATVSFIPDGWGYRVRAGGKEYSPDEVLHFSVNPSEDLPWLGTGYRVALKDVVHNLKQAAETEKGFMESKWKPSLIVKVDALTDEFASPEGRKKLLSEYVETAGAGEPWLIPAEQFSVQEVRPLSLNDLALADFVKLDTKTVASILGVPPFVLGVGDYDKDAWNNFIASTIMPVAKIIEQELTRKLLYSPDLYFMFNIKSLYNYSISEIVEAGGAMVDRMAMSRNEWRGWLGFSPREDMDELLALENYIPANRLGDQSKLSGGE